MTNEIFVEKIKKFFIQDEYKDVYYKGSKTNVIMHCLTHGRYVRKAYDISIGKGCQQCSMIQSKNSKRFSKEDFLNFNWGPSVIVSETTSK